MIAYLLLLFRLALLALSFGGYLVQLSKKIRTELAIGMVFASIAGLMFLGGILDLLRPMAWTVFAAGLLLWLPECKNLRRLFGKAPPAGLMFFGLSAVLLMALLFRSRFIHYDDFSHWAVAVKLLIQNDAFPTMADTELMFVSYPLGSAAFLYYVAEITGAVSEWMQMWSQALLMTGMLAGLFVFGKGLSRTLTISAGAIILLCGNTPLVDLLVDSLLPVTAVSATAFCVYYRSELDRKLWYLLPYGLFLVAIKNSGALFAALVWGCAMYAMPKTRTGSMRGIAVAGGTAAFITLWNAHVKHTFEGGSAAKHSMNAENFSRVLAEKTTADVLTIAKLFWNENLRFILPVLCLLLLGAALLLCQKHFCPQPSRALRHTLWFAAAAYLLYQLGTLGMYILSMPKDEALMMAGFERYHRTILIFCAGLLLIGAAHIIGELPKTRSLALAACVIVLLAAAVQPQWSYLARQDAAGTDRARFDQLIADHCISPGEQYLVVVDDSRSVIDRSYLEFMTQYLLSPRSYAVCDVSSVQYFKDEGFRYALLLDASEANRQHMAEHYGLTEDAGSL